MMTPKAAYPTWLPILLGVLTAVGPLSTDMYLPAFPAIEASLGGRPGTAQITLAGLVRWPGGRADHPGVAVGPLRPPWAADRGQR